MAKDAKPLEVLNANAKQTMATAYWAMDYYFDNLRKIVSHYQAEQTSVRS